MNAERIASRDAHPFDADQLRDASDELVGVVEAGAAVGRDDDVEALRAGDLDERGQRELVE